jgi:thiol-disulfide isomerase/thioredoxin
LVLVAFLIAMFAGGSSSSDDGSDADITTPINVVGQNFPVSVTGTPLPPLTDDPVDAAVGFPAPQLVGQTFDGSSISVAPGDDQAYMIVFLAHWCPHCNAEIPRLVKWFESGQVPENLRVIGVSTAVATDRPNYPPSEWIVETKWPWEIMADSSDQTAASAFGVSGFPFFAIVGSDGLVKVRQSGQVETDVLQQLVDFALSN